VHKNNFYVFVFQGKLWYSLDPTSGFRQGNAQDKWSKENGRKLLHKQQSL
jgi:hypothetical protein